MKDGSGILRWDPPASPIELTRSPKGSLHCVQACMIMAIRSLLGLDFAMSDAERMSGYIEGRETWPYEMFLSFGRLGLEVKSIENIDPAQMAIDPEAEIRRVFTDPDIADYVVGVTDIPAERTRATECLSSELISFEVRTPTMEDARVGLQDGWLPLFMMDYGILHETNDGYEGHMIMVTAMDSETVEIVDPGPPGAIGWNIPVSKLDRSVHSPNPDSGQLMLVRVASQR